MFRLFLHTFLALFSSNILIAQAPVIPDRTLLPNGWSLSPAGIQTSLGDLPLQILASPNNKFLAVTNNGQSTQSIQLIDARNSNLLDTKVIAKSWYGLAWSKDSRFLYASGGNDNRIMIYAVRKKTLHLVDSIYLSTGKRDLISPAGIALDDKGKKLYVVTKENNTLYTIDLSSKTVSDSLKLPAEAYTCVLSPQKDLLYISCWGCDKVLVYNCSTKQIIHSVEVGDNPNEMSLTRNGKILFVANANDNSVSIIETESKKVVETLNAALSADALPGSTSNSLALSRNEKTLYIANADNNCLAVFDISTIGNSLSKGFIPTGWYPTSVEVIKNKIYVANGKGSHSKANPYGPNPVARRETVTHHIGDTTKPIAVQYIGGLFTGTLSTIPVPKKTEHDFYTAAVYNNKPRDNKDSASYSDWAANPIPTKVGDSSPIKYVFYIVKENRTYDQVLGDMKQGNGDSSLVLFGEKITPNQHKLATNFVLFDNFYVDAEVSADGHNWSMGAYATDYLEKTWPTNYGNRGGKYDAEGHREIANNKGGFIWDLCKRNNVSYRSYGEFIYKGKANIPVLNDHACFAFEPYNMKITDTSRFTAWKLDFDSLLAINMVPQFNTVRFGNDHTEGLSLGRPTPYAHVADNDYAVGLFLEHLSRSSIWDKSAVFIVEDDAQNGADHVDAHRSTLYLAGGFVKRNFVDHTMYSTTSVLRTMELILGLPPMTQHDKNATSMWRAFTHKSDFRPFTAVKPLVNLADKNLARNKWQELSDTYNYAREDAVPDLQFNEMLWHGLKGNAVPFPSPRRAAFVRLVEGGDDD